MRIFLTFIIFCIGFASESISINNSTVQFTGSHPFHDWTAVSSQLKTKISCNQNNTICDFNFTIPWTSFDSGNDNRDNNMLYYVNAFDYPNIEMNFEQIDIINLNDSKKQLTGNLKINGINQIISIPLDFQLIGNHYKARSSFQISLENFNIERPSLLLIPIEDLIYIHVDISGNFK